MNARTTQQLRLAAEFLSSLFLLAALYPAWFVWAMATTLQPIQSDPALYYGATGLGLGAMLAVAWLAERLVGAFPRRTLFDLWLFSFPPAVAVTCLLLTFSWPLDLEGWDGHGFGAGGSEANALFLPWLHAVLWIVAGRLCTRIRARRVRRAVRRAD
jgi:hypothetical protein